MPTFKQLKKKKIKEQLVQQHADKISKTLMEKYGEMTDEDWEDFAKALFAENAKMQEEAKAVANPEE